MTNGPIETLEEEHRYIAKVVSAAGQLADRLVADRPVAAETLQNVVDFMRLYADKSHHGKEEDRLFPLLEMRGVPMHGCPLEALLHEHGTGRALVRGLAEAVEAFRAADPAAREQLIKNLRGIAELYPNHIWKEDYLLFPMSHKVLNADDQRNLALEFAQVDEAFGRALHEQYERLSEQLAQTA